MKRSNLKKYVAAFAITIGILTGGLSVSASNEETDTVVGDGTCAPAEDFVCGLNGQNFSNKYLQYVTNP